MKLIRIIPPIFLLMLASCASTSSCPPLPVPRDWTRAEQAQIAKEHNALPPDSILRAVLEEWVSLRAALK
jgi:hypothetical protein